MLKAIENLKIIWFVDTSASTHWRAVFPEYQDHDLPGVYLRAARAKENLTQKQLAELVGIPQWD